MLLLSLIGFRSSYIHFCIFISSFISSVIHWLFGNIFSFCVCVLVAMFHMSLFIFILFWSLHFLDLNECFLSHVKEFFFGYYLLKYFLGLCLSSSSCFSKMRFYLVSSCRTSFYAILFGLSFCVCSLCSSDCKVKVLLASGVWPFFSGVWPLLLVILGYAVLLMGGTGPCSLVHGAGSCASCEQGHVKGHI